MSKILPKSLKEISDAIGGELDGSFNSLVIDSFASSPETSTQNDIVFVYDKKYLKNFASIKFKALILPAQLKDKIPSNLPVIWVGRPRIVLKSLLAFFSPEFYKPLAGIHPSAVIDQAAKIGKNCSIGANAFLGPDTVIGDNSVIHSNVYIGANVIIGKNCLIYPNATILDYCQIGNNVILHSGSVIGADGYSYVTEEESNLEKAKKGDSNFNLGRQVQHKIPTIGNVIIQDDVEIGSNTCVDRATIGSTIIGAGTKIDNLVQVAHNCVTGNDCLIVGQVGFAGSVILGDRVVVGGQSGFADNMKVGNDVIFVARSAVHGDIPPNSVYMGMPAVPYLDYFRNEKTMKRLPRKYEKLEEYTKQLEERINQLEEKLKIGV